MGCGVCKEADVRTSPAFKETIEHMNKSHKSASNFNESFDPIECFIDCFKGISKQNITGGTRDIIVLTRQLAASGNYFLDLWSKSANNRKECDLHLIGTCEEALGGCLEMVRQLIFKQPAGFFPSVILTQFALKLIITLNILYTAENYEGTSDHLSDTKRNFVDTIKTIRKEVRSSTTLRNKKIPLSTFNFELSRLEIGIISIHDPQVLKKIAREGVSIIKDVIESVLSQTIKMSSLFRSVFNIVRIGMNQAVQCRASKAFVVVSSFECHSLRMAHQIKLSKTEEIQPNLTDSLKSDLRMLEKIVLRNCRWEFAAAMADVLARVLLGDNSISWGLVKDESSSELAENRSLAQLPSDFISWMLFGEKPDEQGSEGFLGLEGLATLGDERWPESDIDKMCKLPIHSLKQWMSKLSTALAECTFDVWLNEGVELLKIQVDTALETILEKIQQAVTTFAVNNVENLLAPVRKATFAFVECLEKLNQTSHEYTVNSEALKSVSMVIQTCILPALKPLKAKIKALISLCKDFKKPLDFVDQRLQGVNIAVQNVVDTFSSIFGKLRTIKIFLDDSISRFTGLQGSGIGLLQEYGFKIAELKAIVENLDPADKVRNRLKEVMLQQKTTTTESTVHPNLGIILGEAFNNYLPSVEFMDGFWSATQEIVFLLQQCVKMASFVNSEQGDCLPGPFQGYSKLMQNVEYAMQLFQTLENAKNALLVNVNESVPKLTDPKALEVFFNELENNFNYLENSDQGRPNVLETVLLFLTGLNVNFSNWVGDLQDLQRQEESKLQAITSLLNEHFLAFDCVSAVTTNAYLVDSALKTLHAYLRDGNKHVDSLVELLQRAANRVDTTERGMTWLLGQLRAEKKDFKESSKFSSLKEDFDKLAQLLIKDRNTSNLSLYFEETANSAKQVIESENLEDSMCRIRIIGNNLLQMASHVLCTVDELKPDKQRAAGFNLKGIQDHIDGMETDNELTDLLKSELREWENRFEQVTTNISSAVTKEVERAFAAVSDRVSSAVGLYSSEIFGAFEAQPGILKSFMNSTKDLAMTLLSECQSRDELWRSRERAVYQILNVLSGFKQISNINSVHSKHVQGLKSVILKRKIYESVPEVQLSLDSSDFYDNAAQLVNDLSEDEESKLEKEVEERLKLVEELHEKVMSEADPVKKQIGFITLRKEQQLLISASGNLENLSKSAKIFSSLLMRIQDFLNTFSEKLAEIHADTTAIRGDIRRLVGQRAIEILESYREDLIMKTKMLTNNIYIPLECLAPRGMLLMDKVSKFLENDTKGVLLITGRAGAGKSCFASKLEMHILEAHYLKAKKRGKMVVLIWANLPALKNPMTGLFDEALSLRYHFMEHHTRELREKIQAEDSKLEAVFVLDAYDELRPEFQFRNLFKSNNLEAYRPKITETKQGTRNLYAQPKIVILCRQELLASNSDYESAFLPIEMFSELKDEPREAVTFFEEVEIAPFDYSKFEEYVRAYAALEIRRCFEQRISSISPRRANWASLTTLRMIQSVLGVIANSDQGVEHNISAEQHEPDHMISSEYSQHDTNGVYDSIKVHDIVLYSDSDMRNKESDHDDYDNVDDNGDDNGDGDEEQYMMMDEAREDNEQLENDDEEYDQDEEEDEYEDSQHDSQYENDTSDIDEQKKGLEEEQHNSPEDLNDMSDDQLLQSFQSMCKKIDSSEQGMQSAEENVLETIEQSKQLLEQSKQLFALTTSLAVSYSEVSDEAFDGELETLIRNAVEIWDKSNTVNLLVIFLSLACGISPDASASNSSLSRIDTVNRELNQRQIWTKEIFDTEFKSIPELKGLITTPFMIEIIVQILPKLKELKSTPQMVKQELLIVLNEDQAIKAWSMISKFKLSSSETELKRTQRILDAQRVPEKNRNPDEPQGNEMEQKLISKEDKISNELQDCLAQVLRRIVRSLDLPSESDSERMEQTLFRILQRKPVRRFLLYSEFVAQWIQRECSKLNTNASSMTPENLRKESWEYSTRLACKMTAESLTKITYIPGSILFSSAVDDEWFYFFGVGDSVQQHRDLVRRASPLKESAGVFSYIHKSIQEFLVAKAILDSVNSMVLRSRIQVQELIEALNSLKDRQYDVNQTTSSSRNELSQEDNLQNSGQNARPPTQILNRPAGIENHCLDLWDANLEMSERRRRANGLVHLIEEFAKSQLGVFDLGNEEAVRDFLLDVLLDNIQFRAVFISLCFLCCSASIHMGRLDHVRENLKTFFVLPLPKRDNNTVFHIAALEGDENLMIAGLQFLRNDKQERSLKTLDKILLSKNSSGQSVLAVAAKCNNFEMCRIILDICNERDKIFQDCENFEISMTSLVRNPVESADPLPSMFKSAQTAAISSGKAIFEVEIDLSKLQIRTLDINAGEQNGTNDGESEPDQYGFAGQICIAFAKGRAPREESILKHYNDKLDPQTMDKVKEYSRLLKQHQKELQEFVAAAKLKEFRKEIAEFTFSVLLDPVIKNIATKWEDIEADIDFENEPPYYEVHSGETDKLREEAEKMRIEYFSIVTQCCDGDEPAISEFFESYKTEVEAFDSQYDCNFFMELISDPSKCESLNENRQLSRDILDDRLPGFLNWLWKIMDSERKQIITQEWVKSDSDKRKERQTNSNEVEKSDRQEVEPDSDEQAINIQKKKTMLTNSDEKENQNQPGDEPDNNEKEIKIQKKKEKELLKLRKLHSDLVRNRLSQCPLGNDDKKDASYPGLWGISLHVTEAFDRGLRSEVELYCQALGSNSNEMYLEQRDLSQDMEVGNINIFPAKAVERLEPTTRKSGDKTGQRDKSKRKMQNYTSGPYVVDLKGRDSRAYVCMAVDFDNEEGPKIHCCWSTRSNPGSWKYVCTLEKNAGFIFPVVCSWNLKCVPRVNFGESESEFHCTLHVTGNKSSGPQKPINFEQYSKAIQGNPAHLIAARKGNFNVFVKLIKLSKLDPGDLIIAQDQSNGQTLLHQFVQKGRLDFVKKLIGLWRELAIDREITELICRTDREGKAAFSQATNPDIACLLMDQVAKNTSSPDSILSTTITEMILEFLSCVVEDMRSADKETDKTKISSWLDRLHMLDTLLVTQKFEKYAPVAVNYAVRCLQRDSSLLVFFNQLPKEVGAAKGTEEIGDGGRTTNQSSFRGLFHGLLQAMLPLVGSIFLKEMSSADRRKWSNVQVACRYDGHAIRYASKPDRDSSELMTPILCQEGMALRYMPCLCDDEGAVAVAVKSNGRALRYASVKLKEKRALVLAAVQCCGSALKHASKQLLEDRDIILAAVASCGMALQYAVQELRGDVEIVLRAVLSDGLALQFASTELRGNPAVVCTALRSDGLALRFAKTELQSDEHIVKTALQSNIMALKYANLTLRSSRQLILQYLPSSSHILFFVGEDLLAEKEVFVTGLEHDKSSISTLVERQTYLSDIYENRDIIVWNSCSTIWTSAFTDLLFHELWDISNNDFRKTFATTCKLLSLVISSGNTVLSEEFAFVDSPLIGLIDKVVQDRGLKELIQVLIKTSVMVEETEKGAYTKELTDLMAVCIKKDGRLLELASHKQQSDIELAKVSLERSDGASLAFVAKKLKSDKELVSAAISRNPLSLQFADKSVQSDFDTVLRAVRANGVSIKFARLNELDKEKTRLLVETAVISTGMALEFVGDEFQNDPAIVLKAVLQDGRAIQFAGTDFKKLDVDICCKKFQSYLTDNCLSEISIKKMNGAFEISDGAGKLSPDILKRGFNESGLVNFFRLDLTDGSNIKLIKRFQSYYELVMAAVKQNGSVIQYLDPVLRHDSKVIESALLQSGLALPYINSVPALSFEVFMKMVSENGKLLRFLPLRFQENRKIVESAVRSDFNALRFARMRIDDSVLKEAFGQRKEFFFEEFDEFDEKNSDLVIDSPTCSVCFNQFDTVTCPNYLALNGSRLYYEVEILEMCDDSILQIGFADRSFWPNSEEGKGVGDTLGSWSVDGIQQKLFFTEPLDNSDDEQDQTFTEEELNEDEEGQGNCEFLVEDLLENTDDNNEVEDAVIQETSSFSAEDNASCFEGRKCLSESDMPAQNDTFLASPESAVDGAGDKVEEIETSSEVRGFDSEQEESEKVGTMDMGTDNDDENGTHAWNKGENLESAESGAHGEDIKNYDEDWTRNEHENGEIRDASGKFNRDLMDDSNNNVLRNQKECDSQHQGAERILNSQMSCDSEEVSGHGDSEGTEDGSSDSFAWKVGYVIGLQCDPLAGTISAAVNGRYLVQGQDEPESMAWFDQGPGPWSRSLFRGLKLNGPGMYPAISGRKIKVHYTLGQPGYRYCPPPGNGSSGYGSGD